MLSRDVYLRIISVSVVVLMLLSALGIYKNAEAVEPDSDFDGLSDSYEEAIGTDPNNPDTDADGIHDADDPTPKGGMLNTEEVWDTWDIVGRLEIPVLKAGDEFNVSFTVSRKMPDGTAVVPKTIEATLYVYDTRSYYTLDRSMKKEITIQNGTYTYTHIANDPGKYYFILGVNSSQVTLGIHARTPEIARLSREMKIGYVKGAAYPALFTTVKSIYPTLLPGHKAHYYIERYAYSPSNNTHEFLSRFTSYYTPSPVLDSLYAPANGTAYLHLFKNSLLNRTTLNIPLEGLYYNITLGQQGGYNLAVTAYDVSIPWDFSYSVKFPYSRAYTAVINPTVSWVQLENTTPDVYENVSIELHKYSITTTMNESDFSKWYSNGGLRGIAENHPEHANPYDTDVWLSLFYYVYVPRSGATAYTMFDRLLTLKGVAKTNYEFELPGRYIAAVNYHPQQPNHPAGTFPIYRWNGYKLSSNYNRLHYFNCGSDVYLNAFKSGNVYFTNTGSNVSVTGTKGAGSLASWEFAVYMDGGYASTELFADYDKTVNLGQLAKGKHDFRAVALFSPNTRTVVEALGVNNFPYNWIGHTTFQVKDFLLYVNTPSTLVREHAANLSVLVYGPEVIPVENVNIDIHMSGHSVPRKRMTTGKTGADGLASLSFLPPQGNYYRLEITASKGAQTEKVETYAWIRSEQLSGYIHTNKPVYLPGDTILAQFTIYEIDNAVPLAGPIEVRLSYDGNGKDVIRENLVLDEFGTADTEFPISKDAPWGTYRIAVYHNGNYILGRDVGVRYYETPDTRIVFDSGLALRTGEVEIPVKVEYMFGAPVYQGTVSYQIQGYENRYEYTPWYWWDDYDMDGILFDYGGDYWGGWWYDPAPLITLEMNETVENGWANLTVEIPAGLNRIELEAVFSDDYDHSSEASTTYYVGEAPDPDLKTGIDIVPSKEPFTAADDPKFTINTYNYKEIEKGTNEIEISRIANISTTLMINVTSFGMIGNYEGWLSERPEALFNVTTDRNGDAVIDLKEMGVDVFNLSAEGRYYFKMAVSTSSDNTPPVSIEHEFFVHSVIYTVRNDPAAFTPGSNATIMLEAESLVPTIDADYNYTLTIFKRERYYGYYDDYYYSAYDASPVFAVSGSTQGPVNITWRLPEHLEAGRYIIRVQFDNGQHGTVIDHPIEVIDKSPLEITLTPSKLEYFPGDIIDVQVALSEEFTGFVYMSMSAGWDVISKNRYVNGQALQFTVKTEDWHHALNVHIFLVDEMARLVSSHIVIDYGIGPLDIILEMDRPAYEPGENAKLTATALLSDGNPAVGVQISISVVDAAVFEIFQDYSAEAYYGSLVTPWEFEWSYRTILNWDSDTWYPESLPSETISYWPDQIPYWADPYDGDLDGDGMAENGAGQGQGGGFEGEEAPKDAELGDALQAELENTDVREWFTDTALWLPSVITGNDGTAVINLTLPDNIGKWRIKGTGRTFGLVGGESIASFTVSKAFFIEPKLPYKMTQDDEIEIKVLLYNFHETEVEAELGVSANDWIKVFGDVQVRVKIPSNSISEHLYRLKIFGAMKNNLTFIASDFKGSTDAVRKEVFVKPNGALLVSHATGVADPAVTETLDFHEELINGTQKTVLRLAPGYQGLLKMGYSMLAGYPYDCTEQITSRMIPAVLYREYLKETGDLDRWTDRYLSRKIYVELQSLIAKQHHDGGWGWWKGDDSSLWMSGWVLLGLTTAKDSGFFVDPQAIADCQDYLMMEIGEDGTWMPGPGDDMDDVALTAFLYFSLARSGIPAPQQTEQVLQRIMQDGNLTPYGLSLYGLGDTELGGHLMAPIMGELSDMKVGSHFESDKALGGQTECTAWVLYLAAKANDDPALVRELLEWLNSRRLSSGDFGTTTATVAYMFAVLEVLRNAQPIDMDITVMVNGV
ncbi:MAG: alpha-2-macroglobulin family protein, partial [Candidatus Thermoplasmatota archaeon]|nr:alpha-2-macroglobulin family protein [Candidatus Thermoplasmatota archaeon]